MARSRCEITAAPSRPAGRSTLWLNLALVGLLVAIIAGAVALRVLRSARPAVGVREQRHRSSCRCADRRRLGATPTMSSCGFASARRLGAMGKYQQAIEQLNAALKIDPKHTGAYLDLGLVAKLAKTTRRPRATSRRSSTLTDGQQYSALSNRAGAGALQPRQAHAG